MIMLIYYYFFMTYFKVIGKTKSCVFKMVEYNIWKLRKHTSEIFDEPYKVFEIDKITYKQHHRKYML